MSEYTVFDVAFPPEARKRVIVNTDAKNEADDQYAIVHAVLTPSFELHGIIPAHYGTRKTLTSLQESHLVQRNSSPLSSDGIIRIAAIQPWATKRP